MHFIENKGLDTFLSDNKLLIYFVGIYFCFEELFDSLCNVYLLPILEYFNVSVMSIIVFDLLFVWIAYNGCIKYKRRVLVSNKTIGFSIFILFLWTKYRLCTNSAYSLFISSLSYVDFIPLLVGEYIFLRLFRRAPKESNDSSDGFFIDEPITCSKDDLLNRKIDAYDAAEKLLATKTENNAFTFGIVASWGNGKTSFLYMMKEHIDAKNADDVVTISFHPWKYGKSSNLTYLFFEELSKALAPYSTIFSRDIIRYARTVSSIENSTMKFLGSILGCLVPQTVEEQYEDLKKKISNIQRKIVVFIDDIDRLGANEIEELFRLVRNTSNLPSMYFVMAYDKKYVVDTLNSIFSSHSLSYSQKILQEEFFLPVIKNNELEAVLREKLSVFLNSEEMEQVDKLLNRELFNSIDVFSYIGTLRDIKRLANALRLHLRKLHGEIDICDYIILEILRQQYPFVLELILDRKKDILLFNNNSGKYVYFNGENGPEEKESILAKMYPFKGFNILEYIEANSEALSVPKAKIDSLKKLLDALWGEYRTYSSKGINVPEYTQRYLYSSILDSEVSDVEFDKIWQFPFDEMKSTLQEWMVNKSCSLVDKVEKRKVANKADTYKQLHMLFYMGSIGHKCVPKFREIVERIKMLKEMNGESHDYLAEDKEEFLNCLYENGINSFMLEFLCKLFCNGSFEEDFILSEDEVIKIQQDLFLQYIEADHPISDVLDCWRDTSHDVRIADSNGDRHSKKMEHTEVSRKAMKDYAINHITEFVENTISCSLPNTSRKYRINGIVLQIWESWDEYYKDVNSISIQSAKLDEYKKFLEKIKGANFASPVNFHFNEMHIKP